MPRNDGRKLILDFDEIPDAQVARSADGSRVLGWYVCSQEEDRYDERTDWHVLVFDAKSKERLADLERTRRERKGKRPEVSGKALESARFDPRDRNTIVLRYEDRSEETVRLDQPSGAFGNLDDHSAGMPPGWKEYMLELKEKEEARLRRLRGS